MCNHLVDDDYVPTVYNIFESYDIGINMNFESLLPFTPPWLQPYLKQHWITSEQVNSILTSSYSPKNLASASLEHDTSIPYFPSYIMETQHKQRLLSPTNKTNFIRRIFPPLTWIGLIIASLLVESTYHYRFRRHPDIVSIYALILTASLLVKMIRTCKLCGCPYMIKEFIQYAIIYIIGML
ncbi:hypothetical protein BDB01DRAFT_838319 [Pilobolus umbonatus]|nr:hypothetical protein BDB01DRAFT_838319 [Pilobolus umbonatus]